MRKFSILILLLLTALVFFKTGCSDVNNAPPPEFDKGIKSVIPARGPYGAYILIGGKGFKTVSQITFNGTEAQIEASSDTTILTRVPQDATSGPIAVVTQEGKMESPSFTVDGTSTLFLAIQGVQPQVARHRDTLRISGTGFRLPPETNRIFFNEQETTPVSANDSVLIAVVPPNAESGLLAVVAERDTAIGPKFTVLQHKIESIAPRSGLPKTEVTISGSDFSSKAEENRVLFNGTEAELSTNTETKLAAIVPGEASTGPVSVIVRQDTVEGPIFTVQTLSISGIKPESGKVGTAVTISGSGFSSTVSENRVTFSGIKADVESASDTKLQVIVPEKATSGPVHVTVDNVTVKGPRFTVITPNPTIKSIAPTKGPVGTKVTISGMNFSSTGSKNTVKFNKTEAAVQSASETEIVTFVPEGATSGPVSVTVDGKTGQSPEFTVEQPRSLRVVTKTTGDQPDSDGYTLSVSGQDDQPIKPNDELKFNNLFNEQIKAELTGIAENCSVDGSNPRTIKLVPNETVISIFNIVCERPAPVISSITPESGTVGTKVTINGSNFSATASENTITFNGIEAAVKSASITKLVTQVPKDATNGPVEVTVGKKTATGPTFMVEAKAPSIDSVTPQSGTVGTKVTITGMNFSATASENTVTFNGTQASVKSASETQLTTQVPEGATDGPVKVTVSDKTGTSPDFDVITTGGLEINIATTGEDQDPNGYLISIDGSEAERTKLNDTFSKSGLKAGTHQIGISNIASNCFIKQDRSNPYDVDIKAGKTTTTNIDIVCESTNEPPVADFTVKCTGLSCDFDASDSSDPEGAIVSYGWTFGDGADGNGEAISHNYKSSGTYSVQLTVTDAEGATNSLTKEVTVTTTGALEVVITTEGVSQDPNGYKLILDKGDPSTVTKNETVTFNELEEGKHSVELSDIAANCFITQDRSNPYDVGITAGETTTTNINVRCEEPNKPPTSSFTYECQNLDCEFDGSGSSDPESAIDNYNWNFGDGTTATGPQVSHSYKIEGNYTVQLIVTDYDNASDGLSKEVSVTLPQISSVSPMSGPVGTEVVIRGSGFSNTASDNQVEFTSGETQVTASIKSTSESRLVVDVPSDASTGPIYVSTYGYRVSGPTFTVQQPKGMQVDVRTEGTEQDTDGYTISVAGKDDRFVKPNDSVTYSNLFGDEVEVSFSGAANNCRIKGANPRMVSLDNSDGFGYTQFTIDCTRDLRGQILYISNLKGNDDIFAQDEQGNQIQQITTTSSYEYLPKLSPDGLKIAYVSDANGRQVFIMDSDGSDVEQITSSGYYRDVSWSPNGGKLVVTRSDNSDAASDIYTMDIGGGNQQNITNTPTDREGDPDWSADGSSIIYVSGNSNIMSIKPNGSNKVQLSSGNSDSQPEWSPDDTKIVFVRDLSGTRKIHIMNADGTGAYELTPSSIREKSPTWSPDGTKVAYSRKNDGRYSIYIYSVDYGDLFLGPYTPTDDISPHWNYK